MRNYEEMMTLILQVAREDKRIRATYLSGSRVDECAEKDKYSDYDIVYLVKDIESFTKDDEWLDVFGERLIMQKPMDWYSHPYNYTSKERFNYLMQFKDGNRIDLSLIDVEYIDKVLEDREPRKILLNKDQIEGLDDIEVQNYYHIKKPSEKEFHDCCNEFWWNSLNAAKGLCRQELVYVKHVMDRYEMDMFLKMVDWYIGIEKNFKVSTGKYHKYFKYYLGEEDMKRVAGVFSDSDYRNMWEKLFSMGEYFNELALRVSCHFDYKYDIAEAINVMGHLSRMKLEREIEVSGERTL